MPKVAINPLRNLLRRPFSDWVLLAEAAACTLLSKVQLWTLPFSRLAPSLGHQGAETLPIPRVDAPSRLVRQVSWAVQTAGRYIPARLVCLPQAMAAQAMLRRRGVASTLYLGVRLGEDAALTAHAWLRSGNYVLTGRQARPGHATVASFASTGPVPKSASNVIRQMLIATAFAALVLCSLAPLPPLRQVNWGELPTWLGQTLYWLNTRDFVANLLGFSFINALLHTAWFGFHRAPWPYRLRSAGAVFVLAVALELVQLALPHRNFDRHDILAAAIAVAITTLPWVRATRR